ncbi:hypothetical protein [Leucobacter sp. M11]|uniref:hypothetical protein n=1 Tax=Leucobacter sp. M11 TaxID=2993565 RepID=UPI002D80DF9E|nr:hypothetical protein [Leucobacter sp. M11]MEB4613524.1 hypothetical protein [Leucobacter sp. M11]
MTEHDPRIPVSLGVRARLRASGFARGSSWLRVGIEEGVMLADGTWRTVSAARTATLGAAGRPQAHGLFSEAAVRDALRAALRPEDGDAEHAGEARPWDAIAATLRALGIEASAAHLRGLPERTELAPGLLAELTRLSGPAA